MLKNILKEREEKLKDLIKSKEKIDLIEAQLHALPFYIEYTEALEKKKNLDKEISKLDKDIFEELINNNIDRIQGNDYVYKIKESSKPSIEVVDESKLPKEAFTTVVKGKKDLGNLIKEYESSGQKIEGVKMTYKKSLEII